MTSYHHSNDVDVAWLATNRGRGYSPASPAPSRQGSTCRRLATNRRRSMPVPLTSGPLPLDQSRSVATRRRPRWGTAWTTTRPDFHSASSAGATWAGCTSTSTPTGRKASALCTRTSANPIASEAPGSRNRLSATVRSRSASSGTGTPLRRFAALFIDLSGPNPPRSRSMVSDRYVRSAFCTRCASTSRNRHSSHHDADSHATSSSDSIRSANWRRRRATSCRTSVSSTTLSLVKTQASCTGARPIPDGRSLITADRARR